MAVGDQAPRTLYRAVFGAELEDWKSTGRLRPSPSGMEGKHFAESDSDAVRFGRMLQQFEPDGGPCHVLRVEFDAAADIRCHDIDADRIGPAYLASIDALDMVRGIEDQGLLPSEAGS